MNVFFKKIIVFVGALAALGLFLFWQFYGNAVRTQTVIVLTSNQIAHKTNQEILEEFVFEHISHKQAFNFYASYLDLYSRPFSEGRYFLKKGMSVIEIVRKLKLGLQDPLELKFNNVRTREDLAGIVSSQIKPDSAALLQAFKEQGLEIFIPNTYEMWWTVSADDFVERMKNEYQRFWTQERERKRKALKMSRLQVSVLASIIHEESKQRTELPRIAGVYINRLNRGMNLQADPTVKFALGDFGLKRILNKHLTVKSPYNTYINKGLPPTPISIPEIVALEAVLDYEKHNFLYFCARPQFDGYHNFATNYADHLKNARKYTEALNALNIN